MPRTYTLTYDKVTPESAEHGDYSDHGFGDGSSLNTTSMETIDAAGPHGSLAWKCAYADARAEATEAIEPDEYDLADAVCNLDCDDADPRVESHAAVSILLGIMRDLGATEPSASDAGAGVWYTTPDGSTDYRTGEETRVSVHLDGWSEEEERAIYAAVTGRNS
jgi:hypothetical protein